MPESSGNAGADNEEEHKKKQVAGGKQNSVGQAQSPVSDGEGIKSMTPS